MAASKLFILSGDIQSGKTTALYNWSKDKDGIGGFLTPDVDGLRYLHLLAIRNWLPFETKALSTEEPLISIGKFNFFQQAFDLMSASLNSDQLATSKWIIIDELGKLELKEKGLYQATVKLLAELKVSDLQINLVLVVRSSLVKQITAKFGLSDYELVGVDYFKT